MKFFLLQLAALFIFISPYQKDDPRGFAIWMSLAAAAMLASFVSLVRELYVRLRKES